MSSAAANRSRSPSRLMRALMRRFDGDESPRRHQRSGGQPAREAYSLEAIEPRLLLSADLGFDDGHLLEREVAPAAQIFFIDTDGVTMSTTAGRCGSRTSTSADSRRPAKSWARKPMCCGR